MEKDLTELKQPITYYMKYWLISDLKKVAKNTDQTMSKIVETALIEYFENHNLIERKSPDTA